MAKAKGLTANRIPIHFNKQDHDFYDTVEALTNKATANKIFMARLAYLYKNGQSPEYRALFQNHGIYLTDVKEDEPGSPGMLVSPKSSTPVPVNTYIGDLRKRISDVGMLQDIHRHFESRIDDNHERDAEGMPNVDAAWDRIAKGKDQITYDDLSEKDLKTFAATLKELKVIGATKSHTNKNIKITKPTFKAAFKKAFIHDLSHVNVPINLGRQTTRQKAPGDPIYGGWFPGHKATQIAAGEQGEVETSKLKELQSSGKKKIDNWFFSRAKTDTTIPDGDGGFFTNLDLESMAKSRLGGKFADMWPEVLKKLSQHLSKIEKLTDPDEARDYYLNTIVAPLSMGTGQSHAQKQNSLLKKLSMGGETGARGSDGEEEMDFSVDGVTGGRKKASSIEDEDDGVASDIGRDVVVGPESAARDAFLLLTVKQFKADKENREEIAAETGTIIGTPSFNKHMQDAATKFVRDHRVEILETPDAKEYVAKHTEKTKQTLANKDAEQKKELSHEERGQSYSRMAKELKDMGMSDKDIEDNKKLAIQSYDSPEAKEQLKRELGAKLTVGLYNKEFAAQQKFGEPTFDEKRTLHQDAQRKAEKMIDSMIKDLHAHATKAVVAPELTHKNVIDKIDSDAENDQLASLYNKAKTGNATRDLTSNQRPLTRDEVEALRDKREREIAAAAQQRKDTAFTMPDKDDEADEDDVRSYRRRF